MTIYTDASKQVDKVVELLAPASAELMGHNADCYCEFCSDDELLELHNKLGELYGRFIMASKRLKGEEY